MRDQGLGSWPRRRARMTPGKAALVQDGTSMSYGDLDRALTRLAHGLRARGLVRTGEEVDEAGVLAHLDGRLARYKLPKSVVFVPELPRNTSGKLLKSRLPEVTK